MANECRIFNANFVGIMNQNIKKIYWVATMVLLVFCTTDTFAQVMVSNQHFTRQDTLRGSVGPFRQRWDVLHYDITVQPDYESKTIKGKNILRFFDAGARLMQIDLQEPMILDSAVTEGRSLAFRQEGNVYWLMFRDSNAMYKFVPGPGEISLYFHGKPIEAKRAPWEGGWIWKKDKHGNAWMSVACQGLGASVWYPCKDYQGDEPDSGATLRIIVPDSLVAVGNGRFAGKQAYGTGYTQWNWEVKSPINNYNIVPYIGKYEHFGETFPGEKGPLSMDYWVLEYNVQKAKTQFADAPKMMKAFEHWFGPYPFYQDGYKLVESPHLGMEHQSAVAYGNGFQNGYMGHDRSGTGWGKKWDFIIVHESGHEWFANNITSKDIADLWIHESFTNYSEALFTEFYYGKDAASEYVMGERRNISNNAPIIGPYGVNEEGSGDMYDKGGNMLHTIRQVIHNDEKFRRILRGLNKDFYHQTVTSADVESYMSRKSGKDLSKIFDQYLRTKSVPVLEYKISNGTLQYRWTNCVPGFAMPLKIADSTSKKITWIYPTDKAWKTLKKPSAFLLEHFDIDRNFYIKVKKTSS